MRLDGADRLEAQRLHPVLLPRPDVDALRRGGGPVSSVCASLLCVTAIASVPLTSDVADGEICGSRSASLHGNAMQRLVEATTARDEGGFLSENEAAIGKMMAAMTAGPIGDVDRDFVAMMVSHHQGAIDMAVALLRDSRSERLKRLARRSSSPSSRRSGRCASPLASPSRHPRPTTRCPCSRSTRNEMEHSGGGAPWSRPA